MMIILATDRPEATIDGERIIVSFPSGADKMQVSLSLHDAMHLFNRTRAAAFDALDQGFASPKKADLIPFPTREAA